MYASQIKSDSRKQDRQEKREISTLFDPSIIRAARQIYRTYYEVHPDFHEKPIGVAIHKSNHRGKLIFGGKPVLLPEECFVPLAQLESEIF